MEESHVSKLSHEYMRVRDMSDYLRSQRVVERVKTYSWRPAPSPRLTSAISLRAINRWLSNGPESLPLGLARRAP
jgi:hypothetical protein